MTAQVRICLLVNGRSGSGRGGPAGDAIATSIAAAGGQVERIGLGAEPVGPALSAALAHSDGLIAVGGDGTMHSALPALIAAQRPGRRPWLYHAPCGTENLFARHLGMSDDPVAIARAVAQGRTRAIDLGLFALDGGDGRPFALMVSAGPDASVVHRRATGRERGGHATYIRPVVSELACPNMARVSVSVDGRTVVDQGRGLLVIGNCPRYALGHDPCCRADMSDGLLDTVFFPAAGRVALWRWARLARAGRHIDDQRLVYSQGRTIRVVPTGGYQACWQIDGEPVRLSDHAGAGAATITVLPGAIPVLLPPESDDAQGRAGARPVL